MSGKVRQRTSANAADSATQSVNEKILKECHSLYTEPENGEKFFLILSEYNFFLFKPHTKKCRKKGSDRRKSNTYDVMEN